MSFNCRLELQMRSIAFIIAKTIEKHIANILPEFDDIHWAAVCHSFIIY